MEVELLYLIILIDLIPGLDMENVPGEKFHVVYTLQHDEKVDKEILKAGSIATDAEYMSPAMKESLCHVQSGLEPVKVNMNK
eukprot:4973734-Ditylum_brightwellii.AAC.1